MFKTILICLDGSSLAEQVVQYAANMARRYSSRVVLLQVIPSSVAITPGVSVQTLLSVEQSALDYLQGVASSMKKGRGPVDCVTAQSSTHSVAGLNPLAPNRWRSSSTRPWLPNARFRLTSLFFPTAPCASWDPVCEADHLLLLRCGWGA